MTQQVELLAAVDAEALMLKLVPTVQYPEVIWLQFVGVCP